MRWTFATRGEVFGSPSIGADGTIYVGSYDHSVYAIDGATGQKKWSYASQQEVFSTPAIGVDGTVYFGGFNAMVYAIGG